MAEMDEAVRTLQNYIRAGQTVRGIRFYAAGDDAEDILSVFGASR